MITKRTDELKPGDRVQTPYGVRTVRSVLLIEEPNDWGTHCVSWEKEWYPSPRADWVTADHFWQVEEPSKLDLAVQRAQELADQYFPGVVPDSVKCRKDFAELLDLFRATR